MIVPVLYLKEALQEVILAFVGTRNRTVGSRQEISVIRRVFALDINLTSFRYVRRDTTDLSILLK